MLAGKRMRLNWPSPLMIQRATRRGFVVLARPDSPLYALTEGEAAVAWGPCGAGAPRGRLALVCDAGCAPMVAPLAERAACVQVIGAAHKDGVQALLGTPDGSLTDADAICVALPPDAMETWCSAQPQEILSRALIFVGAKVGCGIGACRGCHILSAGAPGGLAVCRCGPFLPLHRVDLNRDRAALGHFGREKGEQR